MWIGCEFLLPSLQGNTKGLFSFPAMSKFAGNLCIPFGKERLVQIVFKYVKVHFPEVRCSWFFSEAFLFSKPYEQHFHENSILALDLSTHILNVLVFLKILYYTLFWLSVCTKIALDECSWRNCYWNVQSRKHPNSTEKETANSCLNTNFVAGEALKKCSFWKAAP